MLLQEEHLRGICKCYQGCTYVFDIIDLTKSALEAHTFVRFVMV